MKLDVVTVASLASQVDYNLHCVWCGFVLPIERMERGAITCCPDHQAAKRKAQKRFLKLLAREKAIRTPRLVRLAQAFQAQQAASGTATAQV